MGDAWQASPSHYGLGIHGWMLMGWGGGGAKVTSKKSRFSGPTPSNAPSNDVALLKSIKDTVQQDGSGPN